MRLGPQCGAAAALAVLVAGCATVSTQGPDPATGTVDGHVLAAPACPMERLATPCPPRPVPDAQVEVLSGAALVAHQHASATGLFEFHLPPGPYVLRATNPGAYSSTIERPLIVTTAATQGVTLVLDSGIR